MKRLRAPSWEGWQKKLEDIGFVFHSLDAPYWNAEHCYRFDSAQIDFIEKATNDLQELVTEAIGTVLKKDWFDRMKIPGNPAYLIEQSWERDRLSLYGRFDLAWDGSKTVKLLEYNADTPTSLLEAAVAQWLWLQDCFPKEDQFNSIHEKLIARWPAVAEKTAPLHFTCMRESVEDICQTQYLRDTAMQAGFDTRFLYLDEIGWDTRNRIFVDQGEYRISQAFKLYPWEWLLKESFGAHITPEENWIEPPWKILLSNKALLPILWELFPDHPLLLPAWFDAPSGGKHVRKPLFSREGANVSIIENGKVTTESEGPYGEDGYVYQAFHELPCFDGHYAVTGSWIIGEEACGIGIREDTSPITQNLSRFVPHYFTKEKR